MLVTNVINTPIKNFNVYISHRIKFSRRSAIPRCSPFCCDSELSRLAFSSAMTAFSYVLRCSVSLFWSNSYRSNFHSLCDWNHFNIHYFPYCWSVFNNWRLSSLNVAGPTVVFLDSATSMKKCLGYFVLCLSKILPGSILKVARWRNLSHF